MDFFIPEQQLEFKMTEALTFLKEKGYSETTLKSYRSFLRKAWLFMKSGGNSGYTKDASESFLTTVLPELSLSASSKRHVRTAVRRFNDYLSGTAYAYSCPKNSSEPPEVFQGVLEGYLASMEDRGLKPATIKVRCIFAIQFLRSMEEQGIDNTEEIMMAHVGTAFLSAGSPQGFCEKIPCFLRYLHHNGRTRTDLSKAVPSFRAEIKLPTIYKKEELLQMLNSIDCGSTSGKRDYAIMLMLAAYGIRAADLINLKVANVDFQCNHFSFVQSKTGNEYHADLLPAVRAALLSYLAAAKPESLSSPLFQKQSAPYGALTRSALWSIVDSKLKQTIRTDGRKKGPHAIRSSMASGLITDNVPYAVVQRVLGHTDPNATKRYASIDTERLRKCALECPEATGRFASYLEGCAWK